MRKARVCKHFGQWRVDVVVLKSHGVSNEAHALAATHSEAMFLAQLLADPHEYIRATQEKAVHGDSRA